MEIPLQEIFALVSYIHADMENGVQLNPEWEETVEKVRVWAVACKQSVQPTCGTLPRLLAVPAPEQNTAPEVLSTPPTSG